MSPRSTSIALVLAGLLTCTLPGSADAAPQARSPKKNPAPAPPPPPAGQPYKPTSLFTAQQVEGWTVMVEKILLSEQADVGRQALRIMANQLYRIKRVLPPAQLAQYQKVKIWLQYEHPTLRACQFHPGKDWLRENHINLDKWHGVDIPNAKGFIHATIRQPCVMLHELSHAYHCLVLGFDHPDILQAYRQAKASGKYDQVLNWWGRRGRHYAMKDHKEYFAESCEAFFGTNDFYPFVASELKEFDPTMYNLLKRLFDPKAAPVQADPPHPGQADIAAPAR